MGVNMENTEIKTQEKEVVAHGIDENFNEVTEVLSDTVKMKTQEKQKPKEPSKRKNIKVRAKINREKQKHGFYANRRIYDGEEFTIKSMKDFSEKWMVKI